MEPEIQYKPIVDREQPGSHTNTLFIVEPFAELFTSDNYEIQMQYARMGLLHAESSCFVRESVKKRIEDAITFLPDGLKIRILDAWRPFKLQEELYKKYYDRIVRMHGLIDFDNKRKIDVVTKYVSYPDYDRNFPPVHTTGGAIDVTLIDKGGIELNMGTCFDDLTNKAHTCYYEVHEENIDVRNNRRILYHAMIKAGFTNFPSEWWHYDYGDKFWGYYKQCPALYRGVFDRSELNAQEE